MRTTEILKQISKIARENKIDVYAVGGYVRDSLLKKQVKDIDFVVLGDGVEFARLLKKKLKAGGFVIFERFGTAMIQYDDHKLEFVGARSETYSPDSRKPLVQPADLTADLRRRDFTINALLMHIDDEKFGEIFDPLNGRADLENRILRTPLTPEETFFDDPLRIMRAIRFATQLNFQIEPQTFAAISKMRERLKIISQERITEELIKILSAPQPSIGFKLMSDSAILEIILPEINAMKGIEQREDYHHKDVFNHTIKVIDNIAQVSDKFPLRFVALVHDIGKPKTKQFKEGVGWTFYGHDEIGARMVPSFCRKLKLPNDLTKYTEKLVRLHLRPIALAEEEVTDSAVRRLIVQAGEELDDLMILCRADITSGNPQRVQKHLENFDILFKRIQEVTEKDTLSAFQSPVRGEEIMEICGLNPGPIVGKLKKMIEEAILEGIIPYDRTAALEYLLANKDKILVKKGKIK
ncbi:HD domain-containing protein [candidate division KSB1 bacterium]|nr:HD domain-containing protein [candidate division KSB1 bacterium]